MSANHSVYTSDYLQSTRSVLGAGQLLQNVLGADKATLDFAVTGLERAAQQQDSRGSGYHAFMFSGLDKEENKETRERLTEDVLVSILADMQTANVLMAAGQTVGEIGKQAEPRLLNEAILRLEDTTRAIEGTLSTPISQGAAPGRFGFMDVGAIPDVINSSDLPAAVETFRRYSNEALATLVNEAEGLVNSVISGLSKLDTTKVLEALSNLGGQIQALPKAGRLIRQGIEKLEKAIKALSNLLGRDALEGIKNKVEKIWQDLNEGRFVDESIKWAFDIDTSRTYIEEVLRSQGLNRELLDKASKDLVELIIKFKDTMAMVKSLLATVTFAGTVLIVIPQLGPNVPLIMAFAYFMMFAAVILIGRDYAGSGIIFERVRGVREIASSMMMAQ